MVEGGIIVGTSRDHKGSSNRSPLVPAHADAEPGKPVPDAPMDHRFRGFRTAMRGYTASRDTQKRDRALGRYARDAVGGASTGSRRFGAASLAGSATIAGLAEMAAGGTGETSTGKNLSSALGKSVDEAAQIIAEALAPENESHDRIRDALEVAICATLEGEATFQVGSINDDFLAHLLLAYLAESVFQDVWLEAGDSTNAGQAASDPMAAENDLRQYVLAAVDSHLDKHLSGGLANLSPDQIRKIQLDTVREVLSDWEGLPE